MHEVKIWIGLRSHDPSTNCTPGSVTVSGLSFPETPNADDFIGFHFFLITPELIIDLKLMQFYVLLCIRITSITTSKVNYLAIPLLFFTVNFTGT